MSSKLSSSQSRPELLIQIAKYSFNQSFIPSPEGLLYDPVDPSEWFHDSSVGMAFRIFKTSASNSNSPCVRMTIDEFRRSGKKKPKIELNIPELYNLFPSVISSQKPPFHIVAKDPVMGVLYLASMNGQLVTHRFQVKFSTSEQFNSVLRTFGRLNCPINVLTNSGSNANSNSNGGSVPNVPIKATQKSQQIAISQKIFEGKNILSINAERDFTESKRNLPIMTQQSFGIKVGNALPQLKAIHPPIVLVQSPTCRRASDFQQADETCNSVCRPSLNTNSTLNNQNISSHLIERSNSRPPLITRHAQTEGPLVINQIAMEGINLLGENEKSNLNPHPEKSLSMQSNTSLVVNCISRKPQNAPLENSELRPQESICDETEVRIECCSLQASEPSLQSRSIIGEEVDSQGDLSVNSSQTAVSPLILESGLGTTSDNCSQNFQQPHPSTETQKTTIRAGTSLKRKESTKLEGDLKKRVLNVIGDNDFWDLVNDIEDQWEYLIKGL